jgi:hypothetical protein
MQSNASTTLLTNPLAEAFKQMAINTGTTWNGDVNFASLGEDFQAALLELSQVLVLSSEDKKNRKLSQETIIHIDSYYNKLITCIKNIKDDDIMSDAFHLVFRFIFYLRSVRHGKKERLLSHYMFIKMYHEFPRSCLALVSLIPEYGYFGDLDRLIIDNSDKKELVSACLDVYKTHLYTDCITLFGKPFDKITNMDAITMKKSLQAMTPVGRKEFLAKKHLSLAAKWFPREGKSHSNIRKLFLEYVYKITPKNAIYYTMTLRNIISTLTICLDVTEVHMCADEWEEINPLTVPAACATKHRKAFLNEELKEDVPAHMNSTGNRHPDDEKRVECRMNFIQAAIDNKLKGAALDIDKLATIVSDYCSSGRISMKLSYAERLVIAAQWNDLYTKLKTEIDTIVMEEKLKNPEFLNPMNVIPVVDTSGSMTSAGVAHIAIILGILGAHLNPVMPGCMISFSEQPSVFYLKIDSKHDIFDHFLTVMSGPMGYNTNVDATYRLLLDLMVKSGTKETDFALLFLTDGQFDQLAMLPSTQSNRYGYGPAVMTMSTFQQTFIGRLETAFQEKGYNLPRTIFWNLNGSSPGFPATADMKGVQLVSGYSQILMKQVFTGDYEYEVQEDGTERVAVDPWTSFLKQLMQKEFNSVQTVLSSVGEGCLTNLPPPLVTPLMDV